MLVSKGNIEHFNNTEPVLLSEIIYDLLNINYLEFKELLNIGAIYVNNERQYKDRWIIEDSLFRVHAKPRRFKCDYPWKSLIVHESDFFLVLNKPSGIPSHPSVDNAIEDALTQTSLAIKTALYVTHRLDTLTSGLIIYGKKRQFVKSFNTQLIERRVEKKYVALVESTQKFPQTLTHYMDPTPGTPKKLSSVQIEGWDVCSLEILDQKIVSPNLTWLKLKLLTGRTHQIRSQLSFLQAPILGDYKYCAKRPFQENSIALRSCEIQFEYEGQNWNFKLDQDFDSM